MVCSKKNEKKRTVSSKIEKKKNIKYVLQLTYILFSG